MSQPTTAAAGRADSPGAGTKAPAKKYAGLTRNQWLIVGALAVGALVYIVWKKRSQSSAAAPASSTASECTDANGNSVPCDQSDYSGQLSALQTELESLLAAEGQSAAAGGTTTTSTGGTTSTGAPTGGGSPATYTWYENGVEQQGTAAQMAAAYAATGTNAGQVVPGGTGTPAASTTTAAKTLPAPSGVHSTKVTTSSITVAWTAVPGATGYRIRVTYQSALVSTQQVTGTSATISGLTSDHTYGIHVATVNAAGTGAEGDTDIKTSK